MTIYYYTEYGSRYTGILGKLAGYPQAPVPSMTIGRKAKSSVIVFYISNFKFEIR